MPSIPSSLISLDTSMAPLALRLVAYLLPGSLCASSTDLISGFAQSLLECWCVYSRYRVKELQEWKHLKES